MADHGDDAPDPEPDPEAEAEAGADAGAGRHDTQRTARRTISRRTFIGGAAGLAAGLVATGVGIQAVSAGRGPRQGRLVTPLLATPGFIVAHRGGSKDWPEMSMDAYRHSVDRGANALEISLARTSDGVWFGLHDATLDRTSGTKGFVAAEHTWAEVRSHRIDAVRTHHPGQRSQPYLRFEDLVAAFGETHAIFVDPKAASHIHYSELLGIMTSSVDNPAQSFVAKGYCRDVSWPDSSRALGLESWGYFYGREVAADVSLLPSTQGRWTLLGMDYGASAESWRLVRGYSKPVLGHIIPNRPAADLALSRGAAGLVVSGISEVL